MHIPPRPPIRALNIGSDGYVYGPMVGQGPISMGPLCQPDPTAGLDIGPEPPGGPQMKDADVIAAAKIVLAPPTNIVCALDPLIQRL